MFLLKTKQTQNNKKELANKGVALLVKSLSACIHNVFLVKLIRIN